MFYAQSAGAVISGRKHQQASLINWSPVYLVFDNTTFANSIESSASFAMVGSEEAVTVLVAESDL